jgi:hypothetical protein
MRSEQWKPPGITFTGAESRDASGPPGRKEEDTPDDLHGSNCLYAHQFYHAQYEEQDVINIPIGPNQSGCVGQRPTLGPRVNLSFGLALCTSKCEAVHFGEVERALSLPVFGVDSARHETVNTRGCATKKNENDQ